MRSLPQTIYTGAHYNLIQIIWCKEEQACSGVDALKFLPQLWSNVDEKINENGSIHVLKLDFIASNDCSLW